MRGRRIRLFQEAQLIRIGIMERSLISNNPEQYTGARRYEAILQQHRDWDELNVLRQGLTESYRSYGELTRRDDPEYWDPNCENGMEGDIYGQYRYRLHDVRREIAELEFEIATLVANRDWIEFNSLEEEIDPCGDGHAGKPWMFPV